MAHDPHPHPHKIERPQEAIAFLLAGKARFTLVSPRTGARFTYRVAATEQGNAWFVSLMTGTDNESGFSYLGLLRQDGTFGRTKGSKVSADAPGYQAFDFAVRCLRAGRLPIEFWHEGRCGKCGRTLTVPTSIRSGIGPECAKSLAEAA